MSRDAQRIADLVEINELCSRYLAYASQFVPDQWLKVFTPDAEYSAFGTKYPLERMTELLTAAPRGQFIGSMPVVEFDGDRATGVQHFVFIDQKTHAMRLAWYTDEYVRTPDGWRIRRRSTTLHAQARRLRFRSAARPARGPEERDRLIGGASI